MAFVLLVVSLGIGVAGFMLTQGLGFIDALLFAAMILTGMGPTSPLTNDASKLFASAYAVFGGIFFLTFAAVILAPVLHRFLHAFHVSLEERAD